jgi:hypothetical protein
MPCRIVSAARAPVLVSAPAANASDAKVKVRRVVAIAFMSRSAERFVGYTSLPASGRK